MEIYVRSQYLTLNNTGYSNVAISRNVLYNSACSNNWNNNVGIGSYTLNSNTTVL
jgi:alkyl sulfatase BDS1-like metallo-beta-lactamase superfamily hydrolase